MIVREIISGRYLAKPLLNSDLLFYVRIFGGDWNSDRMDLYGILLPPRTSSGPADTGFAYRIFTGVMIFMEKPIAPCCTPKWSHLLSCGKLLLLLAAIAIRLLRVMAIAGSVALFVTHVVLRSSGHSAGADDDEDTNTRAALNLFYALVVAQALLSYMVVVYTSSRFKLVEELRNHRGLRDLDDELLELYYAHVRRTCRNRGAAKALKTTIIRFALESLTSAVHGVRESGVKTLHVLMESSTGAYRYREKAALKTRDSPEAMASLRWMAGLVSPDERPKRDRAASILANLATYGPHVNDMS